jgi:hypothetical protein
MWRIAAVLVCVALPGFGCGAGIEEGDLAAPSTITASTYTPDEGCDEEGSCDPDGDGGGPGGGGGGWGGGAGGGGGGGTCWQECWTGNGVVQYFSCTGAADCCERARSACEARAANP